MTKTISWQPDGYILFCCRILLFIAILVLLLPVISRSTDTGQRQVIKIGVLANRGVSQCFEDWKFLAGYLSDYDDANVLYWIEPLRFQDVDEAVQQHKIDFLIINPYLYVEMADKFDFERLATVVRKTSQGPSSVFGGTVFTRTGRRDIQRLEDLRDKKIAAVAPNSFGGWITIWRELQAKGLDPKRDFADLTFCYSQDKVVLMVRNGQADAGFIRSGILEKMAAAGSIHLDDLKIIHEHPMSDIPDVEFLHSTRVYPEWPFVSLEQVTDFQAKKVAIMLYRMPAESQAARAAGIVGWTVPLDYQRVNECLKELRLGPYSDYGHFELIDTFTKYWRLYLLNIGFVLLLLLLAWRLRHSRKNIIRSSDNLKDAIAKLHQLEAEQKEQLFFLGELLNALPNPVFYKDNEGKFLGYNQAFIRLAGISGDELLGKTAADFLNGQLTRLAASTDDQALEGRGLQHYECLLSLADGSQRYYAIMKDLFKYRDGSPGGVVGAFYDLTEIKKAEKRLKRLSSVVEQASEAIVVTDLAGNIVYCNPAFTQSTGYSQVEALGQNPRVLKSGSQDEAFYQKLWDTITAGDVWHGVFKNKRKDGTFFAEQAAIFPIKDDGGNIVNYAAVKRDITRENLLENQLRLSQRMEAVGQLAAGVAHELNTPIGFVSSNMESVKNYVDQFKQLIPRYQEFIGKVSELNPDLLPEELKILRQVEEDAHLDFILEDLDELFGENAEGFERISQIVIKLREFSRVDSGDESGHYNLNRAIETTLVVSRNEYKYVADTKTELAEDLPDVVCDSGEINQVLLNIIVNAAQAIKEQGREDKGKISIVTDYDDQWVTCRLSDDGPGMSEEVRENIFNPFFTTKVVGTGTGLGLYISYDIIVNKHGGQLQVDSTPGQGTTFIIKLPRENKNIEGVS
ncbi:MAG: PhnD/SsuA/transferrin family substrate-binding protein [Pseudomonadota bacterium]|nr:PhnD/SsuA/transferrin family substrate-binding protein [Pseudomonadota bacterium]